MNDFIILDFETRSPEPIERGAMLYAANRETQILCMGWRTDTMPSAKVWVPGTPVDLELATALQRVSEGDGYVVAHNANFDRLIYEFVAVNDFNFPVLPLEAWYCTSAEARANALPGGLDKAVRALKDNPQAYGKDHSGSRLIKECCIPPYNEDPKLLRELFLYCARDVDATAELLADMPRTLTEKELHEYHVNERVNDRGLGVDVSLASAAMQYAEAEATEIASRLQLLTGGVVYKHTQSARMRDWVIAEVRRLGDAVGALDADAGPYEAMLSAMTKYDGGGKKFTFDKAARADVLAIDADQHVLPAKVREAIELYDAANASSVAKFKRMKNMAVFDPVTQVYRVHGAFLFAGAGQTLRFSSKGLQLHNFRRDCFKPEAVESIKAAMVRGAPPLEVMTLATEASGKPVTSVMQMLAMLLRPALIPGVGRVFVVFDWSAIEARVLPWLANSFLAEQVLDLFRNSEDVYIHAAAGIFRVDPSEVTADMRQIGKVAVLSLGFGGAAGALSAMARNYGLVLSDDLVMRTVNGWRGANQWAVTFWGALMRAFTRAFRRPGVWYHAGRVAYIRRGPHVFAKLPCGTELCYLHVQPDPSGEGYTYVKGGLTPKADARKWPRSRIWHGLLAENVTQAAAASCLRWLLSALYAERVPVVAHTHDEVISEVPLAEAEQTAARTHELMTTGPEWAEGLPLAAEGGIKTRYGK